MTTSRGASGPLTPGARESGHTATVTSLFSRPSFRASAQHDARRVRELLGMSRKEIARALDERGVSSQLGWPVGGGMVEAWESGVKAPGAVAAAYQALLADAAGPAEREPEQETKPAAQQEIRHLASVTDARERFARAGTAGEHDTPPRSQRAEEQGARDSEPARGDGEAWPGPGNEPDEDAEAGGFEAG